MARAKCGGGPALCDGQHIWLLIFLVLFCTCLREAACATAIALAHAVGEGTVKTKERNGSNESYTKISP